MATKSVWDEENQEESLGRSTNLSSGIVGAGSSQAPGTQAKGTNWTNLQTYLDANKGSGSAIADAALSTANKDIQDSTKTIDDWAGSAKGRIDGATKKDDWSGKIQGDLNSIDKNAFQSWKGLENYWGARDATQDTGYGDALSANNKAKSSIANADSWEGQAQLVRNSFGKNNPKYTTGMGTLDTFVARGDAQNKFDDFKNANQNFGQNFDSRVRQVNQNIADASKNGQAAADNVYKTISQRQKSIEEAAKQNLANVYGNAQKSAEQQIKDKYKQAGLSENIGWGTGGLISRASDLSWQDALGDPELDALNTLSQLDLDANTNDISRPTRPMAVVDWDGVNRNIEAYRGGVGTPTSPGTVTQVGTVSENRPINATDTGSERFDINGNRIDDGLSADEWLNRILYGTGR